MNTSTGRCTFTSRYLDDWRGLYMVLEAAEDGNGGEERLISKKWAAEGAIKAFKETANSYNALGHFARHGTVKQGVPTPKQTLDQAQHTIRTIMQHWGNQLSSQQDDG